MEKSSVRMTYVFVVPWSTIIPGDAEKYARMTRESLGDMVVDGATNFDKGFVCAEVLDENGDLTIIEEE